MSHPFHTYAGGKKGQGWKRDVTDIDRLRGE
jgi:hypothetical protein